MEREIRSIRLSRKVKILAVAGLCVVVVVVGIGLAALLAQFSVYNSMSLTATANLQLTDSNGVPITSFNWGSFTHLEVKEMDDPSGYRFPDATILHNDGIHDANVTWTSDIPSSWTLEIDTGGSAWAPGTYMTIPFAGSLTLNITLAEVSAIVGQPYSFNLNFTQVG